MFGRAHFERSNEDFDFAIIVIVNEEEEKSHRAMKLFSDVGSELGIKATRPTFSNAEIVAV
jgi:hypothetical protein